MSHEIEPVKTSENNLGIEAYPEADIDRCLMALAIEGGNVPATVRFLKAAANGGRSPNRDTIRRWRDQYPARYAYHTTERAKEIEDGIVRGQRELIAGASIAAQDAVSLEHKRILEGDIKDAAASARNLQTVAGIGVTKIMEMTGRPTQIIEHRRPEDIVRRLNEMVVDSDAEEEAVSSDHAQENPSL